MWSRVRSPIGGYPELAAVLLAVAFGLLARAPLAWLAARQGINVLLAVLVFATALTIEPAALRRAAAAWWPLLGALATGITVLPALSWAVSLMVAAGPLRDGIVTVGLAPCEIASVATTAMAGGEAAVAAGVLIGSTVLSMAAAGPLLALEAGHADVRPGHIAVSLAVVVAAPLAFGIGLRACLPGAAEPGHAASGAGRRGWPGWAERGASGVALGAVAGLVALVAAQARLSAGYFGVALALLVFLAGSALAGRLIGGRGGIAVLLTTSMRDFAIAAGLAAAAFGPAAAAPLGLYGILVLVWGTAAAGRLRRRGPGLTKPLQNI
jgi:predicted Na+-dependent transporter